MWPGEAAKAKTSPFVSSVISRCAQGAQETREAMRRAVKSASVFLVALIPYGQLHAQDQLQQMVFRRNQTLAPTDCTYQKQDRKNRTFEALPIRATDENTLVFNHRDLATSPPRLHVLKSVFQNL